MSRPTAVDVYEFLEGYGITNDVISAYWIEKRIDGLIIPWIEKHTRLSFDSEKEVIEYLSGNGQEILTLSRKPVNELVSINYVSSYDTTLNIVESVELDSEEGILIKKSSIVEGVMSTVFPKGNKNIKVIYKYGYDDFIDNNEVLVDIKEAIIYMTAKRVLVQVGARTGGGSISSQAWSRNFGNRGKYNDMLNALDADAYEILKPYMTGVVGT